MAAEPDVNADADVDTGPGARAPLPRLLDAGDGAFTIEFGTTIAPEALAAVAALDAAIARAQAEGRLPGLIETMPTFRSLTVFFDPLVTGRIELQAALRPLLTTAGGAPAPEGRHWQLPVCYDPRFGPDLADVAAAAGLSPDAVVAQHSGTPWRVHMLGFLPGFPFMGDLPAALHRPRRTEPRVRVPAGSVAIAGALTAVYPWESPGGWHLLGRCPVRLFDAARPAPSLLSAGDTVRFRPVSPDEYARLEAAQRAGELPATHWLDTTPGSACAPHRTP